MDHLDQELLLAVLDHTPDRIYFKDLQSRFIRANRAQVEFFGLKEEKDLLGKTDREVFSNIHAEEAYEDEQQIIRTGQPITAKTECEIYGGKTGWVSTTKAPLRDRDGSIIGTFGISRDITEQHEAELLLAQAIQDAHAATRAKSEFLAIMSHEIRTPLNGVIGMTGLLDTTSLDSYQRDCVDTIRTSGEALLSIINDILDFSKIESGKLDLENAPFDLRDCIEESLDLVGSTASTKGLELLCSIANSVPQRINGDRTRLRQILLNLLSNAIKFTHQGEVLISVKPLPTDTEALELEFQVQDTGIGIPPDRMDRLFKAFSQVDSSTTRNYGGTGLGLAISRLLVELMGGSIRAESEPGKGTTFSFTLKTSAAPDIAKHHASPSAPNLAGKKVLIVDDNQTNRKILCAQLRQWHMLPKETSSGSEALQLLDSGFQPDLAILDMQMPEMDGLMLACKIRALPGGTSLPIAILTSIGQLPLCGEGPLPDACLHKPVKQAQLYKMIATLLGTKEHGTPILAPPSEPRKSTLRLLVAEDNPTNQKVTLLMLHKLGHNADLATHGLEVLETFRLHPYDTILMDVQMPGLDGLEATRQLRKLTGSQDHPWIIALTANALQGEKEKCLEAGMNDYVSKPVRLEELDAALKRAPQV